MECKRILEGFKSRALLHVTFLSKTDVSNGVFIDTKKPIGSLCFAYPRLSEVEEDAIKAITQRFVVASLLQQLFDLREDQKFDYRTLDDTSFAMYIAGVKGRSWKDGCAICLEDDDMGVTCGCGFTEIVMFKPCGHTLCIPCFEKWMTSRDVVVEDKTVETESGESFQIVGFLDVDLNLKGKDVFCPMCKVELDSSFRLEGLVLSDKLYDLSEQITKDVLNLSKIK